MKVEFKKIAEENVLASEKLLGDFYEITWKLVDISNSIIQKCLMNQVVADDIKKTFLLVMLRNCISDICCCIDALERGHERTVLNNLRMVFEDLCCVIHIYHDNETYAKFLNANHQASASVGPTKKLRPSDEVFHTLYGELSKISHHGFPELIARQMIAREGLLSHLKPINANRLYTQITPIMIVILLTRIIGEFSEEICLNNLLKFYFWINSNTKNSETPIDTHIQSLAIKANKEIYQNAKT